MYAKSDKFNEQLIIGRIKENIDKGIPSNLREYSNIRINDCLELADLIFDNNLDKIYFLRQYYKSGKVSAAPLTRSIPFYQR